jgi:hypothetical protein
MTTSNGDNGLSQNINGRQMALVIRQPRYVNAFTCTKSCSLDSRKTFTGNDSDSRSEADSFRDRLSSCGTETCGCCQNLAATCRTCCVVCWGFWAVFIALTGKGNVIWAAKLICNYWLNQTHVKRIRLWHNIHSEQTALRRGQRLLQRLP